MQHMVVQIRSGYMIIMPPLYPIMKPHSVKLTNIYKYLIHISLGMYVRPISTAYINESTKSPLEIHEKYTVFPYHYIIIYW